MKPRKESKDWYIATTHWLTAGIISFATAFICGFSINMVEVLLVGIKNLNPQTIYIISSAVGALLGIPSIWLGVMYAAHYVNKNYVIRDKIQITKLASLYLILTGILWGFLGGTGVATKFGTFILLIWSIIYIVSLIVQAAVFYIASKRYIQNTDNMPESTEQNSLNEKTENSPKKRRFFIFWIIYSIVFLLLYILMIISYFIEPPKGPELYNLADNLASLPAGLALILYTFKKTLGPKMLWKFYAVAFLVCDFLFNLYVTPVFLHEPLSIESGVGLLISLPAYIALILYAFRKDKPSFPTVDSESGQIPNPNQV